MKKTITKLLVAVLAVAGFMMALAPASAYAANPNDNDPFCSSNVPEAVRESMGCSEKSLDEANEKFNSTAIGIINAVLGIIGLVAVVFIIYGGVMYMTAAGDTGKLAKAKSTILYAVIGLVFIGLATAIVNFVISGILYHEETSQTADDQSQQQP